MMAKVSKWAALVLGLGLLVVPAVVVAQGWGGGYGTGWGHGPGMMGPYGSGGMGPGMMGPYGSGGMGPGMMGPYGSGGMGPGMMGPYGSGGMGPGMMGPYGYGGPGATNPGSAVTEEQAKQLAQTYADTYLKGFTVDKVLPFTGMHGWTAYSVELKGPQHEVRILHINPWGGVMPFGGPERQG